MVSHTCNQCGVKYNVTHKQIESNQYLDTYCGLCVNKIQPKLYPKNYPKSHMSNNLDLNQYNNQDINPIIIEDSRDKYTDKYTDKYRQRDMNRDRDRDRDIDLYTHMDKYTDMDKDRDDSNNRTYNRRFNRPQRRSPAKVTHKLDNELLTILRLYDINHSDFTGITPAIPTINSNIYSGSGGGESPGKPDLTDAPFEWIGDSVRNINDLIRLGTEYDRNKNVQTNLDMYQLSKLVGPLEELNDMVGIDTVKEHMFNMAIFHLQGLEPNDTNLYNTRIMGDPGVGKTELAGILCKYYHGVGVLKSPAPIIANKDSFVAKYLGQTTDKVSKLVQKARDEGRAIVTDEAYAMLDREGNDSFGREALDFMVNEMTKGGFVWIIMGYEKEIEERLIAANPGMARRFPISFKLNAPEPQHLSAIFHRTCRLQKWKCDKTAASAEFFEKFKDCLPHHGGSILNLFTCCKHAHSRRLLALQTLDTLNSTKKNLTQEDIDIGMNIYKESIKCGAEDNLGNFMSIYN